ncbi:hypothetical protein M9H77_30097 [Catharanthus roseus]|uniref:Uncharacterized protein n=1 Tax=Catharanthus roseus TaxID=4058 RepID=A0ACB9ZY57_CATRO|nr:hypothetical protein M9H77_30097 [Catharanthus roseus]
MASLMLYCFISAGAPPMPKNCKSIGVRCAKETQEVIQGDLPPMVGHPTASGRHIGNKGVQDRRLLLMVGSPYHRRQVKAMQLRLLEANWGNFLCQISPNSNL